jgi:hypothetical protein
MKTFLIAALFILPFFASAQDSCQLKKTTDPFTHETKLSTGFVPFNSKGNQLSISIDASATDIDFFLWFTGAQKCFDDQTTIQINFEGDRYKMYLRSSGSMNCDGALHFTFKNSATTNFQLQKIVDKKINSFHITGPNKTITDVTLSPEEKDKLKQMAACIARDAKTVMKK